MEKAHAASANTEHFNQGGGSEWACSDFIILIMKWDICALHSQTHRHGLVRQRLRQDFSPLAASRNDGLERHAVCRGSGGIFRHGISAFAPTPPVNVNDGREVKRQILFFYFGSLFDAEAAWGCKMGLAVRLGECLSFN